MDGGGGGGAGGGGEREKGTKQRSTTTNTHFTSRQEFLALLRCLLGSFFVLQKRKRGNKSGKKVKTKLKDLVVT